MEYLNNYEVTRSTKGSALSRAELGALPGIVVNKSRRFADAVRWFSQRWECAGEIRRWYGTVTKEIRGNLRRIVPSRKPRAVALRQFTFMSQYPSSLTADKERFVKVSVSLALNHIQLFQNLIDFFLVR